jgi:aquaporin Z
MAKLLTELLGTFFLVLTVGLTVLGESPFAPLAIGSALMIMVYMGGHISGGHYNPAVSLAVFLRGKLPAKDLVPYWLAQIVGALLAAFAVAHIMGRSFAPAPGASATLFAALLVEILFTFALCIVVLNTATDPAVAGNSYFGLAIGFTVVVAAFGGGPVSGGAFNPAVGIGPTFVHSMLGGGSLSALWLYIVGPLAGGALAAWVYKLQHPSAA